MVGCRYLGFASNISVSLKSKLCIASSVPPECGEVNEGWDMLQAVPWAGAV
jgi:hypothetical protein